MKDLRRAVQSFVSFIQGLPPDRLQPSETTEWGPLEVLCHLAFWHERYVAVLEAIEEGRSPAPLGRTFKTINDRAVATYLATPRGKLVKKLENAQHSLERAAAKPGAGTLAFSFRNGSKVRPLPEAIELIAGHISLHEKRLRRPTRAAR